MEKQKVVYRCPKCGVVLHTATCLAEDLDGAQKIVCPDGCGWEGLVVAATYQVYRCRAYGRKE